MQPVEIEVEKVWFFLWYWSVYNPNSATYTDGLGISEHSAYKRAVRAARQGRGETGRDPGASVSRYYLYNPVTGEVTPDAEKVNW